MNKLIGLIFVLSVIGTQASAQLLSDKQQKIAETYLNLIFKGQQEETWALFDKAKVPAVTKEQFAMAFTEIQKSLALFDTFTLASTYSREVSKTIFRVYRFEAASKIQNILTDVIVDVIFLDTSSFVAGMQSSVKPKDSTSLTSKNKETPIEKAFTAVFNGTSYEIRGINIVHFSNNFGLLAIQVERKISAKEFVKQGWTNKEAVKFAKYLIAGGYVDKAKLKARELGVNLVEDLGVSFIDPRSEEGINVKLGVGEFK